MTGKDKAYLPASSSAWLAGVLHRDRHYFAVDGGGGAALFALLSGPETGLIPASSTRDADLLVIAEPVSRKLAPSVIELFRAMPRPRRVVVLGPPGPEWLPHSDLVRMEDLLPNVVRLQADASSFEKLRAECHAVKLTFDEASVESSVAPQTISLPDKKDRELATELTVLSLGPVQPFTAGPLRLLLACDGEQVVKVEVEAGYAARNIASLMTKAAGSEIARLARLIDPLAPLAGTLAYANAVERLRGETPDPLMRLQREGALALERSHNQLFWVLRFSELLAYDRLSDRARQLVRYLSEKSAEFQGATPTEQNGRQVSLSYLANEVAALRKRLESDRALRLRTAHVGAVPADRLRNAGVTGLVLEASERAQGDVLSRLLMRLEAAERDLRTVAACNCTPLPDSSDLEVPPPGQAAASIAGPRGTLGIKLRSNGEGLTEVTWQRPSAALLNLLPEFLAGQKLADAEIIVTSLDLAMAEADG